MKNLKNLNLPIGRHHRAPAPHKGWYSRGYLPHSDHPDAVQTLTFRLDDSLPQAVLKKLNTELQGLPNLDAERRKRIEELLDAGYGSCVLRDPRAAGKVEEALLRFDGERYRLIEWVVMPNHVHVIFEPLHGNTLANILHSWRSYTAHEINKILNRTGRLWARGKFDRYVRDEVHLQNAIRYVHNNPVKAGLARTPEDWPFGSARLRAGTD